VREVHVLNLGAGVQSSWLYLAFMGLIKAPFELPRLDVAIWSDTGDEPGAEARERGLPDTPGSVYAHLDWLRSLNGPTILGGTKGVISQDLARGENSTGQRFASIPAFTKDSKGKVGKVKRQCTKEYKLEVIGRTLRRDFLGLPKGRSPKGVIVHQYIGLSFDEGGRVARQRKIKKPKYLITHFPLWENRVTRAHCRIDLTVVAPHRVPRSACVQCPFHDDDEWQRIKEVPLDWERAVRCDESLRIPGNIVNRNMEAKMYLHRSCQPLVQIDFAALKAEKERGMDEREKLLSAQGNLNFAEECLGMCGV
jgi:hypothetical protein